MLTIWYKDISNCFDQWEIDGAWPAPIDYDNVAQIVAWDKELELILKNFRNLPVLYSTREMSWFGDTAKTILWGLQLVTEE